MSVNTKTIIDPLIKKNITNEIHRVISDLMVQNENYKEKPSILWYDSINKCRLDLFASPPDFLVKSIRNNPYVISRTLMIFENKSDIGVTTYVIQFNVYNKINCITRFNSQIYYLKKERPLLFIFLTIVYYILAIYTLFVVYSLFND